ATLCRSGDPRRRRAGPAGRTGGPGRGVRAPRPLDGVSHPRESILMTRTAEIERSTGETDVRMSLGLDGSGSGERDTGVGFFDHELASEFFRALATNARLTLHVSIESGSNVHHMIEAVFKAAARALAVAVALDPRESGVPSTKGTLT